jgi:polysaccharide pyruvyl transferase WcaK-like protein
MFEAIKILMPDDDIEVFAGARKERLLSKFGLSGRSKFRSVILGGGTLVNAGYLAVNETALSFDVPMHTLGTGVGSSGFSGNYEIDLVGWRNLLNQFESVGVRGPCSKENLEEIGVKNAKVIGDLALALTLDSPYPNPHTKSYILSVALPKGEGPDFPSEMLVEELGQVVVELKSIGYQPIPVAFCEEDVDAIKQVLAVAGQTEPPVHSPKNHLEYFNLLKEVEFVVGVRLHSAILACCAGVPSILVGYRHKATDFMKSMDLMEWHCDAFEMKPAGLSKLAKEMTSVHCDDLRKAIHTQSLTLKKRLLSFTENI